MTAWTPGMANVASVSKPRSLAWACEERTKQACSAPGNFTSSTKRPRPESSAGSSSRVTRAPNCLTPMLAPRCAGRAAHTLCRVERRSDDTGVAGAAAQIAGERLAHILLVRLGIFAQQFGQRDQHSGRTEAALQ